MAGIVAGRMPSTYLPGPLSDIVAAYEPAVLGISPCTELMVLKSYDQSDLDNSDIVALIRSLEHAAQHGANLIYVGLELDGGPGGVSAKDAITLDRTMSKVAAQDIGIICPAGNVSHARSGVPGLQLLASMDSTIAISAVTLPDTSLIAPYSRYASSSEHVAFTAFGGDRMNPVTTTSLGLGYANVWGTSVAAAVATGILANYLSKLHTRQAQAAFDGLVQSITTSTIFPSVTVPFVFPSRGQKVVDVINTVAKSVSNGARSTPEFGWGLIH